MNIEKNDKVAIISKGALGGIPFVGPLIAEVFGSTIPNQRIDRLESFLKILEQKVEEQQKEIFKQKFSDPESIDLIEDSFIQASRALSEERKHYIASLLKNSLINSDIEYIEGKRLCSISSKGSLFLSIWYVALASLLAMVFLATMM